jgi:hypothetical protein
MRANIILFFACAMLLLPAANATYTVSHLNVTVNLNRNTSAQVNEMLAVRISNDSVSQYSTSRVALNLTLSDWQSIIGSSLVEHIINPGSGIYNFRFFPGPVMVVNQQSMAYVLLSYTINNVTVVNQTAPRTFVYSLAPKVFNFEHGSNGEFLSHNTTLTINLPGGATVKSVYPLPDYPTTAFTDNYANTTSMSWSSGEPLSKFTLLFTMTEGVQTEVTNFFLGIYKVLGAFVYVIIAAVIVGFILYTYLKAGR